MSQRCIWENREEMGQRNQQLSASLRPPARRGEGGTLTFWHYGQTRIPSRKDAHLLRMYALYSRDSQKALSSPSVSAMRRWRSHRDRCELASESPSAPGIWLRHPWDADAHLEGIRSGIDAVPGVMKNELSCCDVNTNDLSHDAFA